MKTSNPKVTIIQPKTNLSKSPSLKRWVIKANITFGVILLITIAFLKLIASQGTGGDSGLIHILILVILGGGMIIFYILSFLSAMIAIALNTIYFSRFIHWSISKPITRALLVMVNIVVFLIFAAVLSML